MTLQDIHVLPMTQKNKIIKDIIDIKDSWTNAEIKALISKVQIKPEIATDKLRIGDVIFVSGLQHPGLVIQVTKRYHTMALLSSSMKSDNINWLCDCQSRFFEDNVITKTVTRNGNSATYELMGIYDNRKHLIEIKKMLRKAIRF